MSRSLLLLVVLCSIIFSCKKREEATLVCTTPANLSAANLTNTSATIQWNPSKGSVGFEYILNQSGSVPTVSGNFLSSESFYASGLSPNTSYYFHLRTKCDEDKFSQWSTIDFTTKDDYVTYIIKAGNNYMEGNTYPAFSHNSLKFKAIFDSSCIYSTVDPTNQADICKLYGFADNNSFHQVNSARFGWNWLNDSLRIHAYCYVNSVRIYKELGTVPINSPSDYSIEVIPGKYIFTLNGKVDTMDRFSLDPQAIGYRLYPYFGGDEPAPHEIKIRIKDLN